jgi:RNA polymerase sigma-70 factor (ECF subfamily)
MSDQEAMDSAPRTLVDHALRDPEAFREIIDRHKAMVYSLAYHFFQNRALAEDIAQDVYMELFRNLRRIQSDLHLSFWLKQAVTRKCIDYTRRLKHRRYQPLEEVVEPGFEPLEEDPLLAEALRRIVTSLPDKMRMVVVLRFQEDLKLSEIAEVLDMPVNTVKTTLRRALARLREKMGALDVEVCYGSDGR